MMNGRNAQLLIYLANNRCAVRTDDFSPLRSTCIIGVGLSASFDEIILEFDARNDEGKRLVAIENKISVPIITKDVLIRVHHNGKQWLYISTFDVMRVLRVPMWMPPEWLRFPPHHLRHFYRITDHNPGSSDRTFSELRYSRRVVHTGVVPLYVYSDGSFFIAHVASGHTRSDTCMWRIPRKPHFGVQNIRELSHAGQIADVKLCNVGNMSCVLKIIRVRQEDLSSMESVAKELLVSLMLSIFDAGPEIYDFWFDSESDSVCLLMKQINGQTVRAYTGEPFELPMMMQHLVVQSMEGVTHDDIHPDNAMIDMATNRLVPIDFGSTVIPHRAPSRNFHDAEDLGTIEKRRRLERAHDTCRRLRDPLPATDEDERKG